MAISPSDTLGPYFDNEGEVLALGAINFLDPDTVSNKAIYLDQALTTPATNPVILNSSGKLSNQVFYGEGNYLVRSYSLIDPNQVSPVFPADYALVEQWIDEGQDVTTSASATSLWTVDTIADLSDVDPNAHDIVQVIGYYSKDDDIDNRTYYWDAISIEAADGGSVIGSNVLGTGRWILKSESDVIDVRHFGAIPGSGFNSNGAINSACAYAVDANKVQPVTVYFPQGTYQVIPGTISTVATVKIDEQVDFLNTTAGDFILDLQNRYDLNNKVTKIKNVASTGEVYIDLSSSSYGLEYNIFVEQSIYESLDDALKYCGVNPLLITSTTTVALTQNHNDKFLKFTGTGAITSASGVYTLNVARVVTDDDTVTRFNFNNANPLNLSFDSKFDLLTGWFGDNDYTFYHVAKNVSNVVINKDMNITTIAMNLSTINSVRSTGGVFRVGNSQTVDLPSKVTGQVIEFTGNDDTVTITTTGTFKSRNFVLDDNHSVQQYVRLATANQSVVVFEGEVFTFEVNLDFNFDISLSNVTFQGDVSCIQTMTVDNVRMFGNFYGSGESLVANNSTIAVINNTKIWVQNLILRNSIFTANNCPEFEADLELGIYDSSFDFPGGNVKADNKVTIRNSTVNIGPSDSTNINTLKSDEIDIRESTLNSVNVRGTMISNDVIIRFFDNICLGTFVGPEGNTGSVDTILIERNDFRNVHVASQPYYYPITHVSFTPQTSGYEAIHIANNLPAITSVDLAWDQTSKPNKPGTGTWVAQTDVKFKWEFPAGAPAYLNVPTNVDYQDVFWTPPELLIVTSATGINDNTTIHNTIASFGHPAGVNDAYISDYASDLNKGTGGAGGASYEGIKATFSGGAGTVRGQFHVDFFKH
jgi:hypothetical protein